MPSGPQSSIRLWQLISPTLPVGAYAYSQAMEYAVHCSELNSYDSVKQWIAGVLQHNYCHLDLAVFRRLYHCAANSDQIGFMRWNASLLSFRESSELLAEDMQMGAALMRLINDLNFKPKFQPEECSFAAAFAQACLSWLISASEGAKGMAFSWCENQVACAVKLIPLGQTDGQRLLCDLSGLISEVVSRAWQLTDHELGYGSHALATFSALHETQYSRLFRS
jgi:urease accessory protein